MDSPLLCILCSLLLIPSKSHSTNPFNGGFTISLIHRDSPQSPWYNHSMTRYDRHLAAAYRSMCRLNRLRLTDSPDISSKLVPDNLEYIMSYYIGTPPILVYAFADSGSDLIWTKGLPYFDPSKSFSYTNISCESATCNELGSDRKTCLTYEPSCTFELTYADNSTTSGVLATDKFTFEASDGTGSLVDVGFLYFGYSFSSSSHFQGLQNGCMGLNQEKFSLINQLGMKRFSHCMTIPDDQVTESRMYFGSRAVISGDMTQILKDKNWHYYVTLEGISTGDQRVPIPEGIFNVTGSDDGGVVIDSGTAYTMLRKEGFEPFLMMIVQNVHFPLIKGPSYFELCFQCTYEDLQSLPYVTFHLSGADVRLMKETTFVELENGIWCLAILRSDDDLSVIGNIQMRNLWVGYDLEKQVISFAPADCDTTEL